MGRGLVEGWKGRLGFVGCDCGWREKMCFGGKEIAQTNLSPRCKPGDGGLFLSLYSQEKQELAEVLDH